MSAIKDINGKTSGKRVLGFVGAVSCLVAMFLSNILGIPSALILWMFIASCALMGVSVFEQVLAKFGNKQND